MNHAHSARPLGFKNWMMTCQTISHVSLLCHRSTPCLHVCLVLCVTRTRFESLWSTIIFMFMTFQHLAICVEFHRPQAVSYERWKSCLSTFKRVFPTKIDVDSMFTCHTALHLLFCICPSFRRKFLKFMIVCNTASHVRLYFPRTSCRTLPSSMRGCFVSCVCFMWRDLFCSTATQVHGFGKVVVHYRNLLGVHDRIPVTSA